MYFIKKSDLSKFLSVFINFFSSIKLSVFLLSILALISIFGTVIPQNDIFENYILLYGQIFFNFFNFLGLFDMYHSWWYQFILFALLVNIVVCTVKKLSSVHSVLFFRRKLDDGKFKKFFHSFDLVLETTFDRIYKVCYSFIVNEFGFCNVKKVNKGIMFEAYSGTWTKVGVYIIHLSIVLLILGSILGHLLGFNGFVNIVEGDFANWIKTNRSDNIKHIDFEIHCDLFSVEFYKNGVPREYKSDLVLVKNKKLVKSKSIVVNDPMSFNNIEIFQSGYGKTNFCLLDKSFLLQELEISFSSKLTGYIYSRVAKIGNLIDLPENSGKFCLLNYSTNEYYNRMDLGPSFKGVHISFGGSNFEDVLLPLNFHTFGLMRGSYILIFFGKEFSNEVKTKSQKSIIFYSGLQIARSPGKYVVYCGFFLVVLGFVITIFFSRIQFYAKIVRKGGKIRVVVSGHANRNKLVIGSMLKNLKRKIIFIDSSY